MLAHAFAGLVIALAVLLARSFALQGPLPAIKAAPADGCEVDRPKRIGAEILVDRECEAFERAEVTSPTLRMAAARGADLVSGVVVVPGPWPAAGARVGDLERGPVQLGVLVAGVESAWSECIGVPGLVTSDDDSIRRSRARKREAGS